MNSEDSARNELPDQFEIVMQILSASQLGAFELKEKMKTLDNIIRIMTKKGYTVTERRNDEKLTVSWFFIKGDRNNEC